uniref:RNA-directed DNA polymerase from mobile element jockey n=1 Tax=Lygus hesperus TaxID=30085 RepID=A0A0A9Z7S4_LYGHE
MEFEELPSDRDFCSLEQQSNTYENINDFVSKYDLGDKIFIFHMNIRSASKNLDEVLCMLEMSKVMPDFLVFTEAFGTFVCHPTSLPGYTCHSSINPRNRNDGVVVYSKNIFSCTVVQISFKGATGLDIGFTIGSESYSLIGIYRSPSANCDILEFTDELTKTLKGKTANHCFIVGDINIDLPSENNPAVDHYMDSISSMGFLSLLNEPTRVLHDSKTQIDHVFARTKVLEMFPAIIKSDITNHFATALIFPTASFKRSHGTKIRIKKVIGYKRLEVIFRQTDFTNITNSNDVNYASEELINVLQKSVEAATELKKVSSREQKLTPWITDGIIKSLRTRELLRKKAERQKNNSLLKERYVKFRNLVKEIIRKAKTSFFSNQIESAEGNPKKTWDVIKTAIAGTTSKDSVCPLVKFLINKNKLQTNIAQKTACNLLNTFFTQIGSRLTSSILKKSYGNTKNQSYHSPLNKFVIPLMSESDLENILKTKKGSSAPGLDAIQLSTIKRYYKFLKFPILHVFNLSISMSVFPECFKTAKVIPLYKGGDVSDEGNYRPISMLSSLSKILEKHVKDHLYAFLEHNKVLNSRQFGFRKSAGVEEALYALTSDLYDIREQKRKEPLLC